MPQEGWEFYVSFSSKMCCIWLSPDCRLAHKGWDGWDSCQAGNCRSGSNRSPGRMIRCQIPILQVMRNHVSCGELIVFTFLYGDGLISTTMIEFFLFQSCFHYFPFFHSYLWNSSWNLTNLKNHDLSFSFFLKYQGNPLWEPVALP